jgi:hypothetical protein
MSNAAPLIVLACIMAALFGSMMYVAQRDKGVRRDAAKLIADAGQSTIARSALNGEVVFRKPRLFGFLFFLLFLLILCAALDGLRFNLGSLNSAGRPFTGFSAGIGILISLVPLAMAVRQWRYTVRVSDNELAISTFTTRTVPLQDISEVTIGAFKASSFCQIRLNTGEEDLTVGSDLRGFLDFVKLLSENVNKSKSRS